MRVVKAAVTTSLLLLAACAQQQTPTLTGIVQINCITEGYGDVIGTDDLIIDIEGARLLSYDVESDRLKERTVEVDNVIKDMEKTWTIEKEEDVFTITAKSVFPKKFFDERARKRAAYVRNGYSGFEDFDALTATRQKDQLFQRFKINIKSLSADLYEKDELAFGDSKTVKSAKGVCRVSEPPTRLVSSDQ